MNLGPRIATGEGSKGQRGRRMWRVYTCTVPGVSVFALHPHYPFMSLGTFHSMHKPSSTTGLSYGLPHVRGFGFRIQASGEHIHGQSAMQSTRGRQKDLGRRLRAFVLRVP